MKSASAGLIALLNSGTNFVDYDLWTLTLSGGQVVRWSGADTERIANGNTYPLGPSIERTMISETRGLEVTTMDVTIHADSDDLINGVPLIQFIARKGLDGANIRLDRGYAPTWDAPTTGTLLRFSGRVTSTPEIQGSSAHITVSSWAILLNVSIPADLYQRGCLHTVYDAGCGLNPASFASSSTVTASPAPTTSVFDSPLTPAADLFAQGRLVFTSGANSGLSRTIRTNTSTGTFTIIPPLPVAPATGDAFTAYQGCDHLNGTCLTKFNNLARFRGTPYVPTPETAI